MDPVASTSPRFTGLDPVAARVPQKTLGQDEFMQLLAVQYQMQDPMKPMADTAFLAQSAQFAALEQTSVFTAQLAQLRAEQQHAVANSYLGLEVTVDAGDGTLLTGVVSRLTVSDGTPRLVVGESEFALDAVRAAARPVPPPPGSPTGSDAP